MKKRSVISLMIVAAATWVLVINQSFSFINESSDLYLALGAVMLLGSIVLFPAIFTYLFKKLNK